MIIDLQRRIAEAGRIRIGQQVAASGGKTRPAKLDTFRLTSADKLRIQQAAQLYGGKPAQWVAPAGKQWEVVTQADALDVIVPPSDMAFSQAYELWSAGGCQRRCDGRTESIGDRPCVCDPDDRECAIHTRLSVMLRDLPGLGVWRIDTQGYYAAVELQGAVEVIQMAAGRGQMLPARLRLEQRTVKRPGVDGKPQTRRFAVPVLDIEVSPGQLMGATAPLQINGSAPRELAGTVDGAARLTPVPAALPAAPVRPVAEQIATAGEDKPKARRNAAAPLPSTGLAPRTAAQAAEEQAAEEQAAEEQAAEEQAAEEQPQDDGDRMTAAQQRKLHAQLRDLQITERQERLENCSLLVGRELGSSNDLTKDEASRLIDTLDRVIADDNPAAALDFALAAALENQKTNEQEGGE